MKKIRPRNFFSKKGNLNILKLGFEVALSLGSCDIELLAVSVSVLILAVLEFRTQVGNSVDDSSMLES